jgi:hypothetical protein
MYMFGMIQNGPQGMDFDDEHINNIQSYGIDWEDYDDDRILNHHNQFNDGDDHDLNSFTTINHRPLTEQMSHVDIVEPDCPLTSQQVQYLDSQLDMLPY